MEYGELKYKLTSFRDSFDENKSAWSLVQHTIDYIDMLIGVNETLRKDLDIANIIVEKEVEITDNIRKNTAKDILQNLDTIYRQQSCKYTDLSGNEVKAVTLNWLMYDLKDMYRQYGVEVGDE